LGLYFKKTLKIMQKKLLQNIVFLLLFNFTYSAQAQTDTLGQGKTKVIDFRKSGEKTEKDKIKSDDYDGYRNAIWVDALSTVFGIPSLSYERAFLPNFTAEVGGGMTLGATTDANGAMLNVFAPQICAANKAYWASKGYSDNDTNDFLIDLHDIKSKDNKSTTPGTGYHFFANAKYYFQDEDAFMGLYVAARFNYMRFNYQTLVPVKGLITNNVTFTTEKVATYKTYLDVMPCLGFAQNAGHFVLNYELGIGARSATMQGYDTATNYNTSGTLQDYRFQTNTAIIPVVLATCKVGYSF
jgi:hypothetical protein